MSTGNKTIHPAPRTNGDRCRPSAPVRRMTAAAISADGMFGAACATASFPRSSSICAASRATRPSHGSPPASRPPRSAQSRNSVPEPTEPPGHRRRRRIDGSTVVLEPCAEVLRRLQQTLDLTRRQLQDVRRRDDRHAPLQNLRQNLDALQLALAHKHQSQPAVSVAHRRAGRHSYFAAILASCITCIMELRMRRAKLTIDSSSRFSTLTTAQRQPLTRPALVDATFVGPNNSTDINPNGRSPALRDRR